MPCFHRNYHQIWSSIFKGLRYIQYSIFNCDSNTVSLALYTYVVTDEVYAKHTFSVVMLMVWLLCMQFDTTKCCNVTLTAFQGCGCVCVLVDFVCTSVYSVTALMSCLHCFDDRQTFIFSNLICTTSGAQSLYMEMLQERDRLCVVQFMPLGEVSYHVLW